MKNSTLLLIGVAALAVLFLMPGVGHAIAPGKPAPSPRPNPAVNPQNFTQPGTGYVGGSTNTIEQLGRGAGQAAVETALDYLLGDDDDE